MRIYMGLNSTSGVMNSVGRTVPQLRHDFTRVTKAHIQMVDGLSADVAAKIKPSTKCVRVPQFLFTEALRQLTPESRAIPSGNAGIFGEKSVTTIKDLNGLLSECLQMPGFTVSTWLIESSRQLHLYLYAVDPHQRADTVGVMVPLDAYVADTRQI